MNIMEADDFANDKEIQRLRRIQKEHDEMISECVGLVSGEFLLEPCSARELESFLMFKGLDSAGIVDSFRSTGNFTLDIYLVQYRWTLHAGKIHNSGVEECFLGLLTLNKEYPATYIFKETLKEKITDWFVKQDVDFKTQKKFSRKFQVITQDKEKLKILLLSKSLDELAAFPQMEVEINGNDCLFRVSGNPITQDETRKFIELAKKLSKILS
jgi:hypothetical protein